MSARLLIRAEVPDDLSAIISYGEEHSITSAHSFIDCAFAAFAQVASMPGMGGLKGFCGRLKNVRSWSIPKFPKFLILYRPIRDGIEVIGVLHGARNIRSVLARRLRNSD